MCGRSAAEAYVYGTSLPCPPAAVDPRARTEPRPVDLISKVDAFTKGNSIRLVLVRDDRARAESGVDIVGALAVHIAEPERSDQPLVLEVAQLLLGGEAVARIVTTARLQRIGSVQRSEAHTSWYPRPRVWGHGPRRRTT